MTTLAQLRKTATSLAEVTEAGDKRTPTFEVRGAAFASYTQKAVHLHLPKGEVEQVEQQHPTASTIRGGARVPIADINGQALNYWVRRAWLHRAPKELAAAAQVAGSAQAGTVGDLPRAIGNPATRALADAGITTLTQVANLDDAALAGLHGVGPKAVRILREAIGRS